MTADGGFAGRPGGPYRPDATAWAILAGVASGTAPGWLSRARSRLTSDQLPDGRVCISRDRPEAHWPTPLAVLAWYGSTSHRDALSRAVGFLLHTSGRHWTPAADSPVGHNTAIRGWPWVDQTHSWVEPTALALMALRVAGYRDHERVREGTALLVDRQLPQGGWNYGNTTVFGQVLSPQPAATGMALNALAGLVSRERVQRSLVYLKSRVSRLRTPLSLGWSLLGLAAWGERPHASDPWILETLGRQRILGSYDTSHLALLVVAQGARGGLIRILGRKEG